MPVATDDKHVFLLAHKFSDLITLVGKPGVGMVVVFTATIWPDDGRGGNQQPECRVGILDAVEEPLFLFCPPDSFVGAVGNSVR